MKLNISLAVVDVTQLQNETAISHSDNLLREIPTAIFFSNLF